MSVDFIILTYCFQDIIICFCLIITVFFAYCIASGLVTDLHSSENPRLRIIELTNFKTRNNAQHIIAGKTHICDLRKTLYKQ